MNQRNQDPSSAKANRVHESGQTRARLQAVMALPPLPRRSQELLLLLSDPALNVLRLVEVIEQTPALAARIMGIAASPFFRSATPPRHVSDAIIRLLGLNLVRDLSLSLILGQSFRVHACARFDPMRYWRRAMLTATLCQMLAPCIRRCEAPDPSAAYLAGLLHNLGLLALIHVAPDAMDLAFDQAESNPERTLIDIEQSLLGLDHALAGGEIARAWRLPAPIGAAMRHHPDATYRGADWPLAALTHLASRASREPVQDAAPSADAETRARLLDALGIGGLAWEQVIEQWRARAEDIQRLAAILGGRLS